MTTSLEKLTEIEALMAKLTDKMQDQVSNMLTASAQVSAEFKKQMRFYQDRIDKTEAEATKLAAAITDSKDPSLKALVPVKEIVPPPIYDTLKKKCDPKKIEKAAVWEEKCYEGCSGWGPWEDCWKNCSPALKVAAVYQDCKPIFAKFKKE